jgi:copper resistance protein B
MSGAHGSSRWRATALVTVALSLFAAATHAQESGHIPPPPPQIPLPDLPHAEMMKLMDMNDARPIGKVLFDQLEGHAGAGEGAFAWDAQAWYGGDYDKLWTKIEGEHTSGDTAARLEALWDHVFSRWWSVQSGARLDVSDGRNRGWAALGVQGLAPYWFEVESTLYVGAQGRTALRLEAEYELLLTQRLILQPDVELNAYGKSDPEALIGSGLSDAQVGLRLRYEIRRELAPYAGVLWTRRFGDTGRLFRAQGGDDNELSFVAGVRVWF